MIDTIRKSLAGREAAPNARKQDTERRLAALVDRLVHDGVDDIVIYGAGEAGQFLAAEARTRGIRVHAFVDRNPGLRGRRIDGLDVMTLEERCRVASPRSPSGRSPSRRKSDGRSRSGTAARR